MISSTPCRYCGKEISGVGPNNIDRHEDSCSKHPGLEALRDMTNEGLSPSEIAIEIGGISHNTVRIWLKDAKLEPQGIRKDGSGYRIRPGPSFYDTLVDHPVLSPVFGRNGGCDNCKYLAECHRRLDAWLWMACEKPIQWHVAKAIVLGIIEYPGPAPKWLAPVLDFIQAEYRS